MIHWTEFKTKADLKRMWHVDVDQQFLPISLGSLGYEIA
jgi:hypothetical protein